MNKVALREFTEITVNQRIKIPDKVEDLSEGLNRLGELLTASDWARAAQEFDLDNDSWCREVCMITEGQFRSFGPDSKLCEVRSKCPKYEAE